MIDDHEIAVFPKEVQDRIRTDIAELVRLGRKLRHLTLNRAGSVMMDFEAIEIEADAGFLKGPDGGK
jgi:hypothetical protein